VEVIEVTTSTANKLEGRTLEHPFAAWSTTFWSQPWRSLWNCCLWHC